MLPEGGEGRGGQDRFHRTADETHAPLEAGVKDVNISITPACKQNVGVLFSITPDCGKKFQNTKHNGRNIRLRWGNYGIILN